MSTSPFAELEAPEGPGMLIINPPYGERMDKDEDINAVYKIIGDTLKKNWAGWTAWVDHLQHGGGQIHQADTEAEDQAVQRCA